MISPGMAMYLATCLTTFQREDFQVSNCTQITRLQRPPCYVGASLLPFILPIRIKHFPRSVSIQIRWAGKASKDLHTSKDILDPPCPCYFDVCSLGWLWPYHHHQGWLISCTVKKEIDFFCRYWGEWAPKKYPHLRIINTG